MKSTKILQKSEDLQGFHKIYWGFNEIEKSKKPTASLRSEIWGQTCHRRI